MSPQHEHGLPAFFVELLEQEEWLFLQTKTSLLITMHDIQRVLSPVVMYVIAFKCLSIISKIELAGEARTHHWKYDFAWIFDRHSKRLEELHLRIVPGKTVSMIANVETRLTFLSPMQEVRPL